MRAEEQGARGARGAARAGARGALSERGSAGSTARTFLCVARPWRRWPAPGPRPRPRPALRSLLGKMATPAAVNPPGE